MSTGDDFREERTRPDDSQGDGPKRRGEGSTPASTQSDHIGCRIAHAREENNRSTKQGGAMLGDKPGWTEVEEKENSGERETREGREERPRRGKERGDLVRQKKN